MSHYTQMQREILRAIDLHGGITTDMARRHGWLTAQGLPCAQFRQLVDPIRLGGHYVVAPRVITSQPLRMMWERRALAQHAPTLARIEAEARRLRMREYAPGGFRIDYRPGGRRA